MTSPIWHPFTQHALEPTLQKIAATDGAYLIEENGRRVLDAISSWWVITHGHRHPLIMQAIRHALDRYDQIIFAEYSHDPAEDLARGLVKLAPAGLNHVFYSDSGSTAVEVALKMALGTFHNRGLKRSRIVVMEHSYHGDTIGTMSTGERGVFNAAYEPLLFGVDTIPFPDPGEEQQTLDALERLCRSGQTAALLIEPLVLGAGGMKIYAPQLLAQLREITKRHDVLLIADEVMTGWGRTGTLLACEQAGVAPDILCLSKGITGGALPLAATLATSEIFEAHCSTDRRKTFFHSSSYTANPIACAAAVANLDVWRNEPVLDRIATIETLHRERLRRFESSSGIADIRQIGTIAVVELAVPAGGYLSDVGPKLRRFFRERGALIRPLGNVIYLMPPYCVTEADLDLAYDAISDGIDQLARGAL
ncbi:adenosylmethionine--8-amino-7-oxononanoate transaminase [Rhizobium lemnae]|uniref:Adenosylmethionine-8-amino-7-oxononanoate aminotransferase n=1 Tax=Rhizobium lemnae TaxID=1214924 RepID=A0ABV8EAJ0_9HYPH|nr:adenosylmethionine--8-amino-7-oxononanoate transaminase [Rhizobium lemnae]MCJ8509972.1 adenosylmethionine--8-amino-7-oxononanoate transaminase [Rhizobium lemnae]